MSLRLEMLQVARLAPNLLNDAAGRVADFLLSELCADGGAKDRFGKSDLYYTAFVLEGLQALRVETPVGRVLPYLKHFGDGESLDIIHQACLLRCWCSMPQAEQDPALKRAIVNRVEAYRAQDGGYGIKAGSERGTLYNAFLALGAYQDAGLDLPSPEGVRSSIESMRSRDGGYANVRDLPEGTTPTTAAAATLLRYLGGEVPDGVAEWMLQQLHAKGGFLAIPQAPMPDLLSTATSLHALAGMEVPLEPFQERCLDFVDSLWTGRAFTAHWADDQPDGEYAWYALLALGHLSL